MTIIAIHYTEDNILALADGLISRGQDRVLEQDQKIIKFSPKYKIPLVGLGHFNGFDTYAGGDFCIAYAGNFSLVSTIQKKFISIVTDLLAIDREAINGNSIIYQRDNHHEYFRSKSYRDDFNFESKELIPITVNFLVNILQRVATQACTDFCRNAMTKPDAQFLLFGEESIGFKKRINAQILKCTDVHANQLNFERYSVLPWSLACIGDITAITPLRSEIEQSSGYFDEPKTEERIDSMDDESKWLTTITKQEKMRSTREFIIKNKVLELIQKDKGTIGGDCLIASLGFSYKLQLQTIKKDDISTHIELAS